MTATLRSRKNDDGLGLIELIVAIVVSGIIIGAIAMIFVNSWKTQQQVTSVNEGTNRGQIVGSMIERATRNGIYMSVAGDELKIRTSLPGALKCQGFRITAAGIEVAASASILPATWPVWKPAIKPAATGPYFSLTNSVLTYSFDVKTNGAPVRIAGDVATRSTQLSGSDGCW